jgi:hypothetical protein
MPTQRLKEYLLVLFRDRLVQRPLAGRLRQEFDDCSFKVGLDFADALRSPVKRLSGV